jgi:hypothetical protein
LKGWKRVVKRENSKFETLVDDGGVQIIKHEFWFCGIRFPIRWNDWWKTKFELAVINIKKVQGTKSTIGKQKSKPNWIK